jgi:very-short-patch-repair endonuclease
MNMKVRARNLRKTQTVAETKLWFSLRKRRFCQFKFRRQHVIEPYIVDFICLTQKLIIEVDGSQHLDNQEYDDYRTWYLNEKGFRVLRFWNNEILGELNNVLNIIHDALLSPPSPHPPYRAPSPQ